MFVASASTVAVSALTPFEGVLTALLLVVAVALSYQLWRVYRTLRRD